MPIIVVCTRCGTKMSAPESGVGKCVRCPKPECGTIVPIPEPIPAEEVEVIEAAIEPPPPTNGSESEKKERRRRRPRERDESDDDTERRRRKRRSEKQQAKKGRSLKGGMIVGIVGAGVFALVLLGIGIYALVALAGDFSKRKASPPSGWREYTYRNDGFRAYFPKPPNTGPLAWDDSLLTSATGAELKVPDQVTVYESGNSPTLVIIVARYKTRLTARDRDLVYSSLYAQMAAFEKRSITWLDVPAQEVSDSRGIARAALVNNTIYLASYRANSWVKPEDAAGFFDNIRLLE